MGAIATLYIKALVAYQVRGKRHRLCKFVRSHAGHASSWAGAHFIHVGYGGQALWHCQGQVPSCLQHHSPDDDMAATPCITLKCSSAQAKSQPLSDAQLLTHDWAELQSQKRCGSSNEFSSLDAITSSAAAAQMVWRVVSQGQL